MFEPLSSVVADIIVIVVIGVFISDKGQTYTYRQNGATEEKYDQEQ